MSTKGDWNPHEHRAADRVHELPASHVQRLRDGPQHAPSFRLRTRSLDRTCRGCHLLRSGLAAFNDGNGPDLARHCLKVQG